MIWTNRTTIPTRVSHCLAATALIAGLTIAAGAVVDPASAYAAPEWDIGAYDKCLHAADMDWINGKISAAVYEERMRNCCPDSGGVSIPGKPAAEACRAPKADAPSRTVPSGLPTQTLEPAAPAPETALPTFTLAPASPG